RAKPNPSPIGRKKLRRIFRYRTISRFTGRVQMDKVTWLCLPSSRNYSHWLTEVLPKLYFLKLIGWSEPVAISRDFLKLKWVDETVRLFPDQNFIFVPR